MATKLKRIKGAFSSNPIYDELLFKLATTALEWRATKQDSLVECYKVVLLQLLEAGWDEELDVELELPRKYMPAEYFQRYEKVVYRSSK